MKRTLLARRPSPAMVVALVALSSSLVGAAAAATLITGADIKNGSITNKDIKTDAVRTKHVKNGTLLSKDFQAGQLPAGPAGPPGVPGDKGDPCLPTDPACVGPKGDKGEPGDPAQIPASEGWHLVGQVVGEPQFASNWQNNNASASPVRFYKDPLGVVHLGGQAGPTSNTGNRIYTLPVGYRPPYLLTMVALGCGTGALFVATTGEVSAGVATNVCTMDELTFRAG